MLSHSYYDTASYEKYLQKQMGETRLIDTVRSGMLLLGNLSLKSPLCMYINQSIRSENTPKAAMVSTVVSGQRIMPYVFRNYEYPYRSQSFYRGSAR